MPKQSFPKITWFPLGDKNKGKGRYDDSGRPFEVTALSVPTPDTRWVIKYFSGSFECYPYDETTGARRDDVTADVRLFAPEHIFDPRPDAPKQPPTRRAQQVAIVDGYRGSLSRGHAVTISCGAGTLHVSWEFDEYQHPKID